MTNIDLIITKVFKKWFRKSTTKV